MSVLGLDHVQVAAPRGCEAEARRFYGELLGLVEVEKPPPLRARGGVWFCCGAQQLHVGVEEPFAPAVKAHPALRVAPGELDATAERLSGAGEQVQWDDSLAGVRRFYSNDPWGNRLEFLATGGGSGGASAPAWPGKYARIERERRYLLRRMPTGLVVMRTLELHDRYLRRTGLRLRLVRERGTEPVYKLGQKVALEGSGPPEVAHTTMYLDEAEFGALLALSMQELRKTRHLVSLDRATLAVDVFQGPLAGLVTAEVDLSEQWELPSELGFEPVAEVTLDQRFSGGELAATSSSGVRELLAGYGIVHHSERDLRA